MVIKNKALIAKIKNVLAATRDLKSGSEGEYASVIEKAFFGSVEHKATVWAEVIGLIREEYYREENLEIKSLYETILSVLQGGSRTVITKRESLSRLLEMFDLINIREKNHKVDHFGTAIYQLFQSLYGVFAVTNKRGRKPKAIEEEKPVVVKEPVKEPVVQPKEEPPKPEPIVVEEPEVPEEPVEDPIDDNDDFGLDSIDYGDEYIEEPSTSIRKKENLKAKGDARRKIEWRRELRAMGLDPEDFEED